MVKLILVNVRNGMESITRNSIISRFKNYEHGRFSENHITYNVPGPGKALTRTNVSHHQGAVITGGLTTLGGHIGLVTSLG